MPADAAFDTRKEFKRLAESGSFDEAQAGLLVDHSKAILVGVATKEDLKHAVESLQKDIAAQSDKITLRLGVAMAIVAGALFAALRYLPPPG